jgi:hypothetical protein
MEWRAAARGIVVSVGNGIQSGQNAIGKPRLIGDATASHSGRLSCKHTDGGRDRRPTWRT